MTKTASSSSADPDDSKRSPTTKEFADSLVSQMGQRGEHDLLIRWMVERLAELRTSSHPKREEIEALTLAIWERRAGWEAGWPTPAMVQLAELVGAAPDYFGGNVTGLALAQASVQREMVLWYVGMVDRMDDSDLDIEEGLEPNLNDDEAASVGLHRALLKRHGELLAEAPDGDLIRYLRGLIVDQNRHRLEYFDRLFSTSDDGDSD